MTKRRLIVFLIVLLAGLALAGCGTWASWYVESGVLVDRLYAVETRRNGTVLVWMEHDETGVYCIEGMAPPRAELDEMLRSRDEIEVQYHETRFMRGTPCWGAESSYEGSGFEVFVVDYIGPVR